MVSNPFQSYNLPSPVVTQALIIRENIVGDDKTTFKKSKLNGFCIYKAYHSLGDQITIESVAQIIGANNSKDMKSFRRFVQKMSKGSNSGVVIQSVINSPQDYIKDMIILLKLSHLEFQIIKFSDSVCKSIAASGTAKSTAIGIIAAYLELYSGVKDVKPLLSSGLSETTIINWRKYSIDAILYNYDGDQLFGLMEMIGQILLAISQSKQIVFDIQSVYSQILAECTGEIVPCRKSKAVGIVAQFLAKYNQPHSILTNLGIDESVVLAAKLRS